MAIPLLGDTYVPTESGHFVSEKHLRIAEKLQNLDPNLVLGWIPPDKRQGEPYHFVLVHMPPGRPSYVVFYLKEDELDERIFQRLMVIDNVKNDVLQDVDKINSLVKHEQNRRRQEERNSIKDVVGHIVANQKSIYTAIGYKWYDDRPAEPIKKGKVIA